MRPTWLAIGGMALLAACAAVGEPSAEAETDEGVPQVTSPPASRPPFGTTGPLESGSMPTGDAGDVPAETWQAVLDDLAERVGERIEDPAVVGAGPVTYNDGSLGCPKPGQMYTQALVDGYRVVVEVGGQRYDYRIGRSLTDVRLCESGSTLRGNPGS